MKHPLQLHDLDDGLIVRRTGTSDIEPFAELVLQVFADPTDDPPDLHLAAWTRDLASGRHPLSTEDMALVVEDTRAGRLAAGLWQIPTTWSYAGIPFGVGRPEMVVSHPDYRRRGLVRALFEEFHAQSAAAGHLAQAINGIPFFYRQFGYEYAVDLYGSRTVMFDDIPPLTASETEPFTLREVQADDLPLVMALYERERSRSLVSAEIPAAYWRWEVDGANPASVKVWRMFLIVDRSGAACGCVLGWCYPLNATIGMHTVAVTDGIALYMVLGPVLRALRDVAPSFTGGDEKPVNRINFDLGIEHPVYDALGTALAPRLDALGAWYVRVPELGAFMRHIAPALERRLATSAAAHYTGKVWLDFYRSHLSLQFERGRLTTAESSRRPIESGERIAAFPPHVFLQLLFCRRSLAELQYAFPDVWASAEGQMLLEALFPPQRSHVLPLD